MTGALLPPPPSRLAHGSLRAGLSVTSTQGRVGGTPLVTLHWLSGAHQRDEARTHCVVIQTARHVVHAVGQIRADRRDCLTTLETRRASLRQAQRVAEGDNPVQAESGESGEPPSSQLPDTRGARERLQRYVYMGGPSTSGEQGELCSSPGRDRRAARERVQRDDYMERHPSTDKYGEPPPSPQGGTCAARGQPDRDVNTGGAPISGPLPGTGASADDVDTQTETRERVDQPSSSTPPDRREARDLRRDVNAEGPPSFTGSPLPRLERGESGRSPPSSPSPGSRGARVNQL
ncbi:hypothetical protein ACOMHN_049060 [Nucella lapillus]